MTRPTVTLAAAGRKPQSGPLLRLVPPVAGGGADLRWDRIRTARARVAGGYYDRPDVRERVLEAVLEELETH